ncbi:MAG TPA: hypothetical protein VGQ41_20710 [Pyrinomonadaceae bacterium]|jgi:hypothetical protein|nr:hypothetical protein [Pyrinomonadaceae bacterium]
MAREAVAESIGKHHYQGSSVIMVGTSRIADVLWTKTQRWLTYPWIIFLFITSALLITYCELWGAYRNSDGSLIDNMKVQSPWQHP